MADARFGLCLPALGRWYAPSEPELRYETIKEIALLADVSGFNSILISDHLFTPATMMPGGPGMAEKWGRVGGFEAWTTLSALAAITSKVRLGTIVLSNPFRYPSVVAKMASTLDIISGGRLSLGIGLGWFREECEAFGIPWAPYRTRLEMLRESVQLIKKLWVEQKVVFSGKYYRVDGAILNPKPIQKPHPPIVVGGSSNNILRLAAEEADEWSFDSGRGSIDEFGQRLAELRKYCGEIGRNMDSIKISTTASPFIGKDVSEARKIAISWAEGTGRNPEQVLANDANWIGTAEDMMPMAEKWFGMGVNRIDLNVPVDLLYAQKVAAAF